MKIAAELSVEMVGRHSIDFIFNGMDFVRAKKNMVEQKRERESHEWEIHKIQSEKCINEFKFCWTYQVSYIVEVEKLLHSIFHISLKSEIYI